MHTYMNIMLTLSLLLLDSYLGNIMRVQQFNDLGEEIDEAN